MADVTITGGVSEKPVPTSKGGSLDADNLNNNLVRLRGVDLTPRYFCYLINISDTEQRIPRGNRNWTLSPATKSDPFVEVNGRRIHYKICPFRIASTIVDTFVNSEGKLQPVTEDGEDVAKDALFPRGGAPDCDNGNLSQWGCTYIKRLPSEYAVPTAAELAPVVAALDKTMKSWLEDGDKLFQSGKPQDINQVHRRANIYYEAGRPWGAEVEHPTDCPNCGQKIQKNQLFHVVTGTNLLCIIGAAGWKKAVASGIKQYSEVPEELRWRKEEKPAVKK